MVDTLLASGRVLATDGAVRFRAKWAAAACRERFRVQVSGTDGGFIADISFHGDSLRVLVPGAMECHEGLAAAVPLDSLMGIAVPWEAPLSLLWATLWPRRINPPFEPGSLGSRRGWYAPGDGVFIQIDPHSRLPRYLSSTDGHAWLTMEVRSWESTPAGTLPSSLKFSWQARAIEMWLDMTIRDTEGIDSAALHVVCPPSMHVHAW